MTTQTSSIVDAATILYRRYAVDRPEMETFLIEEQERVHIGNQIYELRQQNGLSQEQLAERVGVSVSSINDLEEADYEEHSLPLLRRIASAFDSHLEFRFRC